MSDEDHDNAHDHDHGLPEVVIFKEPGSWVPDNWPDETRLSTAAVKANMLVLSGRLGMVGEGAAMARKRTQWEKMKEPRMRREREAVWRVEYNGEVGGQEGPVMAPMNIWRHTSDIHRDTTVPETWSVLLR